MTNNTPDRETEIKLQMYWSLAAEAARHGSLRAEQACYEGILALRPDDAAARAWLEALKR